LLHKAVKEDTDAYNSEIEKSDLKIDDILKKINSL
jgi:hypothetical protein